MVYFLLGSFFWFFQATCDGSCAWAIPAKRRSTYFSEVPIRNFFHSGPVTEVPNSGGWFSARYWHASSISPASIIFFFNSRPDVESCIALVILHNVSTFFDIRSRNVRFLSEQFGSRIQDILCYHYWVTANGKTVHFVKHNSFVTLTDMKALS